MTWTEERIQLALTQSPKSKFYTRRWTCVPNVSYGLPTVIQGNREVDLLCVPQSMWVHAVEIKISVQDLKADADKHWRKVGDRCNVRFEWFAVPLEMAYDCLTLAPSTAGVIAVSEVTRTFKRWGGESYDVKSWRNEVLRDPTPNPDARKLTDTEMLQLLRLGVMRMWARRAAKR